MRKHGLNRANPSRCHCRGKHRRWQHGRRSHRMRNHGAWRHHGGCRATMHDRMRSCITRCRVAVRHTVRRMVRCAHLCHGGGRKGERSNNSCTEESCFHCAELGVEVPGEPCYLRPSTSEAQEGAAFIYPYAIFSIYALESVSLLTINYSERLPDKLFQRVSIFHHKAVPAALGAKKRARLAHTRFRLDTAAPPCYNPAREGHRYHRRYCVRKVHRCSDAHGDGRQRGGAL